MTVLIADGTWNSLEVMKLVVSGVTPVVVLMLGIWVRQIAHQLERARWVDQTRTKWRIEIYEELAPRFNDVFSFFCYVGSWKEISPADAITEKRHLDKRMRVVAPLFSASLKLAYDAFIDDCYATYRGRGLEVGLRTGAESRESAWDGSWKSEWNDLFVTEKTSRQKITQHYDALMATLIDELGLTDANSESSKELKN